MKQGGRELLELVRDTRAVQRGVKATLTKGSERGHQPLPVSSLQGCTGANAGAALHGCGQQQGAAVGLMVSIPSFIAFWTMKCCTGVMGFIFSWFKDWYLWGKNGLGGTFHSGQCSVVTQLSGWKSCSLLTAAAGECQEDLPLPKAALATAAHTL